MIPSMRTRISISIFILKSKDRIEVRILRKTLIYKT